MPGPAREERRGAKLRGAPEADGGREGDDEKARGEARRSASTLAAIQRGHFRPCISAVHFSRAFQRAFQPCISAVHPKPRPAAAAASPLVAARHYIRAPEPLSFRRGRHPRSASGDSTWRVSRPRPLAPLAPVFPL
eukprot:129408-Chlamydomonas_euryale.AAC.2